MTLPPEPKPNPTRPSGGEARAEIDQGWALRLQLAAIAGNEPATSRLELRWRTAHGKMARQFVGVRELDRTISAIRNLQQMGDVFVGAAPRVRDSGKAADVARVCCLWVDLDGSEALRALTNFPQRPSIVIRTGSEDHAHAYWPLSEPLPGEWAQRANRRLAKALGGDRASTDPARVLRPAGTLNHKYEPPKPVVCSRLELDVFTADQVVAGLSDDRAYAPERSSRTPTGRPSHPRRVTLDGLIQVVREAPEGQRNTTLHWASCRAGEHVARDEITTEDAQRELEAAAADAGLNPMEIANTIASGLARTSAA